MDIRPLTEGYAVAPQIDPQDAAGIAALGYRVVICNRPDAENPPELQAEAIRQAVEAAGMRFVMNDFAGPGMTRDHVAAQGAALDGAEGPVLAYCASGTRSTIVWALSQAGQLGPDEMIAAAARQGYQIAGLKPQIEAMAAARG